MRLAAAAAPQPLSMVTTGTRAPPGGPGLRCWGQIDSAPQLVHFAPREPRGWRGTMRALASRRQETPGRGFEPLRDRDRLLGRLALTQDHLLMPLRRGPEVIDGGEREAFDEAPQVLELHAACSTALPAR